MDAASRKVKTVAKDAQEKGKSQFRYVHQMRFPSA